MTLTQLLNLRVALLVIAALLGAIGIGNAFVAVFYQSKYEVVYNYDVTVTYCAQGDCAYSASLTVANTGRAPQEMVTVTLTGVPPDLHGFPSITNLSAAEPRSADPVIEQQYRDGTAIINLGNLTPGALVSFSFRGSVPESRLAGKGQPGVTVKAKGRKIEGDPRAITFGRYIS